MPRYYFHIFDDEVVPDEEGVDLPDLAAARKQALEGARDLACGTIRLGHLNLDHCITVADHTGATVMTISFRDAFRIDGHR